ncbi:hypothetical protein LguiB_017138 [Lonicera macranthoides]
MIKPKFFLSLLKKALKFWPIQDSNWDNVSPSLFTNIHYKMTFWYIHWYIHLPFFFFFFLIIPSL